MEGREGAETGRKASKTLTHRGETHTISEWAEITGLSYNNIATRLNLGWSIEDTLDLPMGYRHPQEEIPVSPKCKKVKDTRPLELVKVCKGCGHYKFLFGGTGDKACHYSIDTGELRSLPYEKCKKLIAAGLSAG